MTETPAIERWVDLDTVAEFLGKPAGWVYANQKRLGIPRSKLGNQWRYRLSEVNGWLESQAVSA